MKMKVIIFPASPLTCSNAQYIHYLDLFSKPACRELVTFCIFMDLNFIPVNNNIWKKPSSIHSHFDLIMLVNNIFITCFSQRSLWLGWTNMNCQGKKKCMMLRHRQKIFRKMVKTPCFKAYCKDWRKLFTHVWRNQDGMKVQLLGYLCSNLKVLTTVAQSQV